MIDENIEAPGIIEMMKIPDIYIPLVVFILLVLITIYLRKNFIQIKWKRFL